MKANLLLTAAEIVRQLGVFWGSIEADGNPDYDGIKSKSYLLMEHLVAIAGLAADEQAESI